MTNFSTSWQAGGKTHDASIIKKIRRVIEGKFGKMGYGGIWVIKPIKRINKTQEPFIYKRIYDGDFGARAGIRAVCDGGKEAWEISILQPEDYDILDVVAALGGASPVVAANKPEESVATDPINPTVADALRKAMADGFVFTGRVNSTSKHSLTVILDECYGNVVGVVPLEHLSGDYDRDILSKYPRGKAIKVCVIDVSGKLPKFSVVGASISTKSDKIGEIFTGVPDSDGNLRLSGYVKDLNRRFDVLNWLKTLASECYPKPMPRDDAIDRVMAGLIGRYHARSGKTTVARRVVAVILSSFSKNQELWLELDDRDFAVTERGWEAMGGKPEAESAEERQTVPSVYMEIPKDPLSFETDPLPAEDLSIWEYIEKTARLTALRQEANEIKQWIDANASRIAAMAEMVRDGRK
jgi:hypothetical protein